MRIIKYMIKMMNNDLEEAEHYYEDYNKYKMDYPTIAQSSVDFGKNHLSMYMRKHDIVVDLINRKKSTGVEIPKGMEEIWNDEHNELIDEYDELKYKFDHLS